MVDIGTLVLVYEEKNGQYAKCIVEDEVQKILTTIHEDHRHFSHGITLDRAVREYY